MSQSIRIEEVQVPVSDVERLTQEERFAYYLLGFIFNELMALQKWAYFAIPRHDDTRPVVVQPEMGQALFIFRLACGKIWEAHRSINSKEVSDVLRRLVLPKMEGGVDRLKQLNVAINSASWLSRMRNTLGFHNPVFKDWEAVVQPDPSWVADSIYVGEQSGNTFYAGSDSIVQHWMFGLHGPGDLREQVDPLMMQMIELLGLTNSFLEDAIGVFVTEHILTGAPQVAKHGPLSVPAYADVVLPFWTYMPPRSE